MKNGMPALGRRKTLAVLSVFLLSGCGWHLRGRQTVPFDTMFINLGTNTVAYNTLKRNLEAQTNLKIITDRKKADATLDWFDNSRASSVVAVNTKGRARMYDLRLSITYKVTMKDGATLIPNTILSATRELNWDEEDWNAREAQQEMLYKDMEQQLMNQVVTRLAHITPEMVKRSARTDEQ